MNIEKLKVGQSFKNYKEMCLELEMKVLTSDSKNAQLKELSRFCKLNKVGHRFTIVGIYNTPMDRIENRGKSEGSRNNNNIYGDMVQLLIADLLAQGKSNRLSISRGKLLLAINMINGNYSFCGENVKKLAKYVEVEEQIIYDFYNKSNDSFKNAIETSLKNLMNKRVIWFDTVTKVAEKVSKIHRLATDDEKEIILKCEKSVLDSLGYKTISQVRSSKHWKLFRREASRLLNKECQIEYYYSAYNINVHEEGLAEERKEMLDFLLEETKRNEIKGELNATVYYHLIENAKKRQQNGLSEKMDIYRQSENYILDFTKIARFVIDENAKDIKNLVASMEVEDKTLTSEQIDMLEDMLMFL